MEQIELSGLNNLNEPRMFLAYTKKVKIFSMNISKQSGLRLRTVNKNTIKSSENK